MFCFVLFCFSVCPKGVTLNETSGVFTSPFYPRKYPDDQRCAWKISVAQGNYIKLDIRRPNIQRCDSTCLCDYVQIQDGFSDYRPNEHGKVCGTTNTKTFYSTHSSLEVLFVSDNTSSKIFDGFEATYTQLNHTPPSKYTHTYKHTYVNYFIYLRI